MTYTIDNGHPGSYDHEAFQSPLVPDEGEEVTLTCACGAWSGIGTADAEGEPDWALVDEWESHVYSATGQTPPAEGGGSR